MSTATLPQVRLCEHSACGAGWERECPAAPAAPLFGFARWLRGDADSETRKRIFAQELATSWASDSQGVLHVVPPGDFSVHKAPAHRQARRPDGEPDGAVLWYCVYDGSAAGRDDVLAGVPEWTEELMLERLRALPRVP